MVSADAKGARPSTVKRRGKEESKKVYASALAQYIPHSCMEQLYRITILSGGGGGVARHCTSAMASVLLVAKFGNDPMKSGETGDSDLAPNRVLIRIL